MADSMKLATEFNVGDRVNVWGKYKPEEYHFGTVVQPNTAADDTNDPVIKIKVDNDETLFEFHYIADEFAWCCWSGLFYGLDYCRISRV